MPTARLPTSPTAASSPAAPNPSPSPDAAFDVVVSSLVLHHLPEEARLQAVREMKRVLRPGGKVLLAEFRIPERGFWRRVALLTGHQEMERRVPALEPLLTDAGFQELRSGQAPPWLSYIRATKPPT
jgi:SAM-dependent methyltransferase